MARVKKSTKKKLAIFSIAALSLVLIGSKKYKQAKAILTNLKISIKDLSNVKINFPVINFDAVVSIENPTNIDFGATISSVIRVKQIRVFSIDGNYLGKANADLYQLTIPSNSTIDLPKNTFEIQFDKAFDEFLNNTESYLNNNFSSLKYKIDIEAFGNKLTLDA